MFTVAISGMDQALHEMKMQFHDLARNKESKKQTKKHVILDWECGSVVENK